MSSTPSRRRLRAVFLHGLMQDAKTLKSQTFSFRKLVSNQLDIEYVDSPHLLTVHPAFYDEKREGKDDECIRIMENEYRDAHHEKNGYKENYGRTWVCTETYGSFSSQLRNVPVFGVEDSLSVILEACKEIRADGIMGFSQGAAMAAIVAKKTLDDSSYGWKPKFCVLFSGAIPENVHLLEILKSGPIMTIPSLHILGSSDMVVKNYRSLPLAECFSDPVIRYHEGGHRVPHSECRDAYRTFFNKLINF